MAVRDAQYASDDGFIWIKWEQLEENANVFDEGEPVSLPFTRGCVIGATGNFDTNFVVEIQGSIDLTNWFPCHTVAGAAARLSASVAAVTLAAVPRFLKPIGVIVGAGDASDVDVYLTAQRGV